MKPIELTLLSPVGFRRHPENQRCINILASDPLFKVSVFGAEGVSEVARARNQTATYAEKHIRERGEFVLWVDDDMTFSPDTILMHATVVAETEKAISGRAVVRRNPRQIACSVHEYEHRKAYDLDMSTGDSVTLTPVLAGMGCLMMPAKLFLEQLESSPICNHTSGIKEKLICCPKIIESEMLGHVMVSEDHAYSMSIPGGTWMAEVTSLSGEKSWLDYGHIGEQIFMHAHKAHAPLVLPVSPKKGSNG